MDMNIVIIGLMGLTLFVILSISHLSGRLAENSLTHSWLLRSSCRRTASSSLLILAYDRLSSAKSLMCDITHMQSGISLVYVRNMLSDDALFCVYVCVGFAQGMLQ